MTCKTCGETKCSCKNKDFTKAVIEIDNPEQITLMRKVVIPASMGDDTTVPPVVGKYKNVLLFYEANSKSYLYSSDGIPTLLANGITDYEQAVNLPQINGVTLTGDKSSADLGLQSALTAGDGIEIENDTISISDIEQYAHFFDTVADMQSSTNLVNGSYARTLGYNTINDKCGALYKITSETSDIQIGSNLYAHYIDDNAVYSIDDFDGETTEDKLFTALDSITNGTIVGGDITITKQYSGSNKDYRNICIVDSTINLTIDYWFDQSSTTYNSVPIFKNCSIKGNDHVFYNNTTKVTGIFFDGCDLNHVRIFNRTLQDTSNYTQSPYFLNCTINGVENLITSHICYDLKIVNCRIESATQTLLKWTDKGAIRQGVISNCLIEGRLNTVIEIGGAYGLVIENCYFEANYQGLLEQTAADGACFITVQNNTFFEPITNDYQIRLASSTYQAAVIRNNVSNMPSGKYLCNRTLNPVWNFIGLNQNYAHSWDNNGFLVDATNRYASLEYRESTPRFNTDDNTFEIDIYYPYGEAYAVIRPKYVIIKAAYSGSPAYVGYAIIRVSPRTRTVSGVLKTVCDVEIVDACNKNLEAKTSDVTATAVITNDAYTAANVKITVKIGGFTNAGTPKCRVIDPFTVLGTNTIGNW